MYETCELADLEALGYTEEELATLGYNTLPQAKNLKFRGTLAAGEKISIDFDYSGQLPKADEPICEWFISDSKDGEFKSIGMGKDIVLAENLNGCYVKAVLKPVQENGLIGNAVSIISDIPLAAAADYSVRIDDIKVAAGVVEASCSAVNRSGSNSVLLAIFGYDDSGKMIFASAQPWNVSDSGTKISKTIPEEVKVVKVCCLSNDGILRPIDMSVYGEEQE